MTKFKTNYFKALEAFKYWHLGLKGQATLEDIRLASKAIRKLKDEILTDAEKAIELRQQELQKFGEENKKNPRLIEENTKKINEEITKELQKEIEIEIMPECLEALKVALAGVRVEDLRQNNPQINTQSLLILGEFKESLEL